MFQNPQWGRCVNAAVKKIINEVTVPEKQFSESAREISSTLNKDILGKFATLEHDDSVGRCLVASEFIPKHTVVLPFDGVVVPKPNTWTIQISKDHHLLSVGGSQLVEHSCTPNMQLLFDYNNAKMYQGSDVKLPVIYFCSVRDIEAGEKLAFDYNSSEWVISSPFFDAGSQKDIEGFSKVEDPEYRLRLLPYITPPIRELCEENGLLGEAELQVAGIFAKTM